MGGGGRDEEEEKWEERWNGRLIFMASCCGREKFLVV